MNTILLAKHVSPELFARRVRDNKWDALERALDDLVMDTDYPLDAMQIMSYLQSSLLKRQELFSDNVPMYPNIQLQCDVIDAIYEVMNMNCETDNYPMREERLKELQSSVGMIKVMS